jgi:hypothetical protein
VLHSRHGARFSAEIYNLEDAIEIHALALFEASMRVINGIPLGCSLLLPVGTVNSVKTRKAAEPMLTELDQKVGDGDLGLSLEVGVQHSLYPWSAKRMYFDRFCHYTAWMEDGVMIDSATQSLTLPCS